MTKEWMKQFVDLVKSGAQYKAYQKKLGLDRAGVKAHLGKLAEYEKMLAEVKEVVKPKYVSEPFKRESKIISGLKKVTEKELIKELSKKEYDETDTVSKEDEDL